MISKFALLLAILFLRVGMTATAAQSINKRKIGYVNNAVTHISEEDEVEKVDVEGKLLGKYFYEVEEGVIGDGIMKYFPNSNADIEVVIKNNRQVKAIYVVDIN